MAIKVTVDGLNDANRALRQLPELAQAEAQAAMDVTAYQVSRVASSKAPRSADGSHGRRPGFLASSITWETRPRSLSAVVVVAAAAFYWKFLEYGTRFMAARPFLRPAADSLREDHRRRLTNGLERAASKMAQLAK